MFTVGILGELMELDEGLLVRLGEEDASDEFVLDETSGLAFRVGVTGAVLMTFCASGFVSGRALGIAEGVARVTLGEEANVDG